MSDDIIRKATMTIAAAARALEVSRETLLKWEKFGHIRFVTMGPKEQPIRRVPASEVERLKVAC